MKTGVFMAIAAALALLVGLALPVPHSREPPPTPQVAMLEVDD